MSIKLTKELKMLEKSIFTLFTKTSRRAVEAEADMLESLIIRSGASKMQIDYLLMQLERQLDQIFAERVMGYVVHGRNQTAAQAVQRINDVVA